MEQPADAQQQPDAAAQPEINERVLRDVVEELFRNNPEEAIFFLHPLLRIGMVRAKEL